MKKIFLKSVGYLFLFPISFVLSLIGAIGLVIFYYLDIVLLDWIEKIGEKMYVDTSKVEF